MLNTEEATEPFTIIGSGVCIDSTGVIATCRHVIDVFLEKPIKKQIAGLPVDAKLKKIPTKFLTPHAIFYTLGATENQLFAHVCRVDQVIACTDRDIGLVRVLPHTSFRQGYPHLEIEPFEDVYEGMEIGTCGFPLGNFLYQKIGTVTSSFTKGSLSSIVPMSCVALRNLKFFQLDLTATYGNSGGPVFAAESERVIGLLQGGVIDSDGNMLPGITTAEPIYPIIGEKYLGLIKCLPAGKLFDDKTMAEKLRNGEA